MSAAGKEILPVTMPLGSFGRTEPVPVVSMISRAHCLPAMFLLDCCRLERREVWGSAAKTNASCGVGPLARYEGVWKAIETGILPYIKLCDRSRTRGGTSSEHNQTGYKGAAAHPSHHLHGNTTPPLLSFSSLSLSLPSSLPPSLSHVHSSRIPCKNKMALTFREILKDQFATLNITPQDLTGKTIIVTGSNIGTALFVWSEGDEIKNENG